MSAASPISRPGASASSAIPPPARDGRGILRRPGPPRPPRTRRLRVGLHRGRRPPERRWSEAKALLTACPEVELLNAVGPTFARAGPPRLRPDAASAATGADPAAVWGQALPDAASAERSAAAFHFSRAEAKILHLTAIVRDPERRPVLARLGVLLDAADLCARGLQDGPAMGQALAALRRRWAEEGGRPDTPALLAALGRAKDGLSGRIGAPSAASFPTPGSQDPCR